MKNKHNKMAWFSNLKLLIAFLSNFNGSQLYREMLKLGYLKKMKKIRIQLGKVVWQFHWTFVIKSELKTRPFYDRSDLLQ